MRCTASTAYDVALHDTRVSKRVYLRFVKARNRSALRRSRTAVRLALK
jgi:hypothetical protein